MKTLKDYIAFFEAIPENKWITGKFENLNGCKCAMGHLGQSEADEFEDQVDNKAVLRLCSLIGAERDAFNNPVILANDGGGLFANQHYRELGSHPKERVVNYLILKDLKMI